MTARYPGKELLHTWSPRCNKAICPRKPVDRCSPQPSQQYYAEAFNLPRIPLRHPAVGRLSCLRLMDVFKLKTSLVYVTGTGTRDEMSCELMLSFIDLRLCKLSWIHVLNDHPMLCDMLMKIIARLLSPRRLRPVQIHLFLQEAAQLPATTSALNLRPADSWPSICRLDRG